jgi:hypothetical protein
MSRKNFTTEKIIGMLREAEVALSQGKKVGEICRKLEVSEQTQRRNAEQGGTRYPRLFSRTAGGSTIQSGPTAAAMTGHYHRGLSGPYAFTAVANTK